MKRGLVPSIIRSAFITTRRGRSQLWPHIRFRRTVVVSRRSTETNFCFIHQRCNMLGNSLVGPHPKHVADIVTVTPTHQFPPAKTTISANHDFDFWPTLTNVFNQQFDNRTTVLGTINLRWTQVRTENLFATENIKGKETIVTIVTVKNRPS